MLFIHVGLAHLCTGVPGAGGAPNTARLATAIVDASSLSGLQHSSLQFGSCESESDESVLRGLRGCAHVRCIEFTNVNQQKVQRKVLKKKCHICSTYKECAVV